MSKINLRVRIVHTGKEIPVSLDPSTQGEKLLNKLLSTPGLSLAKIDGEGNPIVYKMSSKGSGKEISRSTLGDAGVKDGDTLLLTQQLIAG